MTDLKSWSDEQLSRAIAEKIEPIDSVPAGCWHADSTTLFAWTPLRCWKIASVHDWGKYRQSAQPRDFINDPACTVMLMERLPQPIINRLYGANWQVQIGGKDVRHMQTVTCVKLGRAVAEAFALSQEIEVTK